MQQFEWIHGAWLGLAIMLEIAANVLLKFSDGFRRKCYGILSLAAVLAAFSALSQAVKGIDLSVAYALWGGFGIAATLAAGWVLFGQRLNPKGWVGVILLLAGMVMIKFAETIAAGQAAIRVLVLRQGFQLIAKAGDGYSAVIGAPAIFSRRGGALYANELPSAIRVQ